MKCNIDPSTQSVYTELVKKLGNNKAMALAMYFNIHNEQGNVSAIRSAQAPFLGIIGAGYFSNDIFRGNGSHGSSVLRR